MYVNWHQQLKGLAKIEYLENCDWVFGSQIFAVWISFSPGINYANSEKLVNLVKKRLIMILYCMVNLHPDAEIVGNPVMVNEVLSSTSCGSVCMQSEWNGRKILGHPDEVMSLNWSMRISFNFGDLTIFCIWTYVRSTSSQFELSFNLAKAL